MNIIDELKTPNDLLDYMSNNLSYGFVGKTGKKYSDMYSPEWNEWDKECIVQNGEEVLESKLGTCWDQVELERLWFDKHNYKYQTFFMWFEVDRENDFPTHTFLIYENNNKYYWFENAFEAQRGIHEFNDMENAIEYVKSKQIEFTKMNCKDATDDDMKCLTLYIYDDPPYHLGVNDYLKFVTTNKIENNKTYKI